MKSHTVDSDGRFGAAGRAVARGVLLALVSAPLMVVAELAVAKGPEGEAGGGVLSLGLALFLVLFVATLVGVAQAPALAWLRRALRQPESRLRVAVAVAVALPLLLLLARVAAAGVARVPEASVRTALLLVAVGVGAPAAVIGALAAAAGAVALRRRLAWTAWPLCLLPLLSAVWLLVAFGRTWRDVGVSAPAVVVAPALALFLVLEATALWLVALLPPVGRLVERLVAGRWVRRALYASPLLALALAQAVSFDGAAAGPLLDRNGPSGQLLVALRGALDLDRDGLSWALGGGDCDDFDERRSPSAVDLPGNGIDEDCDGADAAAVSQDGTGTAAAGPVWVRAPGEGKRYNVLVVCFEATRADHVSGLGYERETTPRLDALMKSSWVFEDAIAPSSTTRESLPALFTGRYPSGIHWNPTIAKGKVYQLADEQKTLAEVLKGEGYWTGALISKWILDYLPSLKKGFGVYELPFGEKRFLRFKQYSTMLMVSRAMQHMAGRKKPWLLYAHLGPPHSPYVRHEGVEWFGDAKIDRYDHEIRKTDELLGVLIDYLKYDGILDDTIIVVFGDHGEEFKEHGGEYHSRTVHAESVHVPLVIRVPGEAPARVAERVSLTDVVPTLLDVMGLRPEGMETQGVSLLQYLTPGWPRPERPIFTEVMVNHLGPLKFRKAIYEGDYKLLWEVRRGKVTLYDVAKDPAEKTPIEDPARTEELLNELKAHVSQGILR